MQPGLSRAIPMGILGFMFGALLVIVIRGLQGLDPIWAPGPGIVIAALTMAGGFVWGIGAFDPRLSVHGDEEAEEVVHEELAADAAKPASILASYTWQITTALLLFLIVIAGFALLPGGLALTQTVVPGASTALVGYADVPLPFGGPTIQVSTLVIFAVFFIWALISLFAAAGLFAFLFTALSRGLAEVKVTAGGTAALSAPGGQESTPPDDRRTVIAIAQLLVVWVVSYVVLFALINLIMPDRQIPVLSWFMDSAGQLTFLAFLGALILSLVVIRPPVAALVFIFTAIILYYVFYFVAIGLIFPQPQFPGLSILFPDPQGQLIFLSLVNAILFALVILRPMLVLQTLGRVARWLARVLRSVPRFLQ
ncbi:MAG: hypothetical protein IT319_10320 [Anaerolineae bacterium]|nr:hypothetical protein [Anaerolineae bacterium]